MNKQDLHRIIQILDQDRKYLHLGKRVAKDFEDSNTKGIPVAMKAIFAGKNGKDIGFAVISISPLKMKQWEKVFKEEQWVEKDFQTGIASFELMYLYIKPNFRRTGSGSKLFGRVLNYAGETGIKSIYAYVSDNNNHALRFYLKAGGEIISNFSEEGNTTAFLVWQNISKG